MHKDHTAMPKIHVTIKESINILGKSQEGFQKRAVWDPAQTSATTCLMPGNLFATMTTVPTQGVTPLRSHLLK